MLKIYLIRHGQDQDNANNILGGQRDSLLTNNGIKQVEKTAKNIKAKNIKFDKVYSSPLKRARKTAEIITNILGLKKPEIIQALIESNFGIMTGKSHDQIKQFCSPKILKTSEITYFLSPKSAETFPQLIERANELLKIINKKHRKGNILLVTHGDLGKMIYAAYYNLPWKRVLRMFHFNNSDLLLLSKNSETEKINVFKAKA